MEYQGIIFDFNGTLFFDNDKHVKAWNEISKILRGKEITLEELHTKLNGTPNIQNILYFTDGKATKEELEKYSQKKEEYYRQFCKEDTEKFHLVDGVCEFFDHLKEKDIPFTIASASIKENIDFFIESFGLDRWIKPEDIVYDDGTYENKIAMFHKAADVIGIDMKDIRIYEDSNSGIRNAYDAGCEQIVVICDKENEEEFLNLKTQINQISILEKKYQDYLISLKSLNEQIISLENEVKDSTYVDLSSLSETIKEVNQQLREKNDDLEKLKIDYSLKEKMIKDIQKINQQLEKDEDTYQRYLDLYNLASGKNNARVSIERYVLATYFENMLIYANVIMKQLSQGRYQLLRKDDAGKGRSQQGLELDVFDQESGNIRSIKTLSGGESFKAALSLALGLSRMVQDYAGGIELNTLFIDEGFGSLDSQSLDQAMNCLMELHHENKLIGIISHVSDLKDRIERQLVVERKQKQSVIQMI